MASKQKVELFGLSSDLDFMRARCCAEDIYQAYPEKLEKPIVVQMLKFQWDAYIDEKKKELRGEMWHFQDNALIFVAGEVKGGPRHFIAWAREQYDFREFRPLPLYYALTEKNDTEFFYSKPYRHVYMDIAVSATDIGRLVFELFSDRVPKTCANFEALCTGERGVCSKTNVHLSYFQTVIHRVVPGGWIQGGDTQLGGGSGGVSIYGRVFEDENFAVRHDKRGIVGMANSGRHTNQSQFYITLGPTPWMDGKYVAFGQLVDGEGTLKKIEQLDTTNERPHLPVTVKACGRL